MSNKIEFRQVVRDCKANENKQPGEKRILDYEVLIDGAHCVTFNQGGFAYTTPCRGYELVWNTPGFHYPVAREFQRTGWVERMKVDLSIKANFESNIRKWMAEGLIPSFQQCKDFIMEKVSTATKEDLIKRETARKHRIGDRGERFWYVTQQLLGMLPKKRDWMDPAIEAEMRALVVEVGNPELVGAFASLEEQTKYLVEKELIQDLQRKAILEFFRLPCR